MLLQYCGELDQRQLGPGSVHAQHAGLHCSLQADATLHTVARPSLETALPQSGHAIQARPGAQAHEGARVTATKRWWTCCGCGHRFTTVGVAHPALGRCPNQRHAPWPESPNILTIQ